MASRHTYQAKNKHHSRPPPGPVIPAAERAAQRAAERLETERQAAENARQAREQNGRVLSWLEGVPVVTGATAPAARPGGQYPRSKPLPPLPPSSPSVASSLACLQQHEHRQQQQQEQQQQQPTASAPAPAPAGTAAYANNWMAGDALRRRTVERFGAPDAPVRDPLKEWVARDQQAEEEEETEEGEEEEEKKGKWKRRWGDFREMMRGDRGEEWEWKRAARRAEKQAERREANGEEEVE